MFSFALARRAVLAGAFACHPKEPTQASAVDPVSDEAASSSASGKDQAMR